MTARRRLPAPSDLSRVARALRFNAEAELTAIEDDDGPEAAGRQVAANVMQEAAAMLDAVRRYQPKE